MTIDVGQLTVDMLAAALPILEKKANTARLYAELELKKLAETIAVIGQGLATGEISEEEAKLLLDMQRNAARSVLITVEGIGVLAAQEAINAALAVAKGVVGAALGKLF